MLYVLRLSSGDCIVTAAEDEWSARNLTGPLKLEDGETIASIRPLANVGFRLSPTESGTLEVACWDDSTLDDILTHEYPSLNEALRKANSVRFMPAPDPNRSVFEQMKEAHESNTDIIREGLEQEVRRLASETISQNRKSS